MAIRINPRALEAAVKAAREDWGFAWEDLPAERRKEILGQAATLLRAYDEAKSDDLTARRAAPITPIHAAAGGADLLL